MGSAHVHAPGLVARHTVNRRWDNERMTVWIRFFYYYDERFYLVFPTLRTKPKNGKTKRKNQTMKPLVPLLLGIFPTLRTKPKNGKTKRKNQNMEPLVPLLLGKD
jgi:hypothetical protein